MKKLEHFLSTAGMEFTPIRSEEAPNPDQVLGFFLAPQSGLDQVYDKLLHAYPDTSWWPLQTTGLRGELGRPWLEDELFEPTSEIGSAHEFFDQAIATYLNLDEDDETAQRLAELKFPPLTDALKQEFFTSLNDTVNTQVLLPEWALNDGHAVVVLPVARPADAPALLGWDGAANYDYSGAEISAVLRNWEDRFGALLAILNFDELTVVLPEHNFSTGKKHTIALEHYFFCPDNIEQSGADFPAYVAQVDDTVWSFWWD
ncbi:hypothetical protein GCM10009621_15890 [Corynebacterium felinum]